MSDIAELVDVFFNGRPARGYRPVRPGREGSIPGQVTIEELVRRKSSVVRVGTKLYRVEVKEVEITK